MLHRGLPASGQCIRRRGVFFEIKANLDRRTMQTFADNNISQMQPGIESLSTPVLKLMKKGAKGISNVFTLRLSEECGLRMHWSILLGFEGETPDHYRHQVEVSRRIRRLRPPLGPVRCEVERCAPMRRFPEQHGLRNLRPSRRHAHCHRGEEQTPKLLAYRFDAARSPASQAIVDRIVTDAAPPVHEWQDDYGAGRHRLTAAWDAGAWRVTRHGGDARIDYRLGAEASRQMAALAARTGVRTLGVTRWWTDPSPYLDFAMSARITAETSEIPLTVVSDNSDPTEAFVRLLAHGLAVEEAGLAVATPLFGDGAGPAAAAPVRPGLAAQLSGPAERGLA
jgi:hypothetical protein